MAAASSLRSLWPALLESYTRHTGQAAPRASFASSGLLATQISNGAPFELFLSADFSSIDRLPQEKLAAPPQQFASGKLQLVAPRDGVLANTLSLDALALQASNPSTDKLLRLAIANPEHAPYGQAAQQALIYADIWPLPSQQLLVAENAAQTLQFVKSGAVQAAFVPQTLVQAQQKGIVWVDLPTESYSPVEHLVVFFKNASASAERFAAWLLTPEAAAIFDDGGLQSVRSQKKM